MIITYNLIKAQPFLFTKCAKKKQWKAKQTEKNLGHITFNDILPLSLPIFALSPQPIVYLRN